VNTRSIKFRLVAWYVGWLTLLFIIFGIFVYRSLGHYLEASEREALSRRVRQIADLVQRYPPDWAQIGEAIHSHFAPEVNNRLTRVTVDGKISYVAGAPLDHSFDPAMVPLPPENVKRGESFDRRVTPEGTGLYVVVLARTLDGKNLVVEEGSAEAPTKAALHAWLVALIGGLALLVSGAVAGGVVLVTRSLQPVDRIIRSAERISSLNLDERLPVSNTRDELERLSLTLNHMLTRLGESFQHNQRFLADASHELRTPLTMINAELDEMLEKSGDRERVRELAASALEEGERLKKIVEGLFALSRLDAGEAMEQLGPVDLGQLTSATADQIGLLAEDKNIRVTTPLSAGVVVWGDKSRLKQVIVNLLDNAIKYTRPGGKIELRVSAGEGKGVLEVADNGIGIPAEALPHVFERFYRADKARSRELGGAGLGLSIVKSICVAHGGSVRVESQEGNGTRLIVELPLANTGGVV
jgi:two-component system OmpR family sensor kinase